MEESGHHSSLSGRTPHVKKLLLRLLTSAGAAAVLAGAVVVPAATQETAPAPAAVSIQSVSSSSKAVKPGAKLTGMRATTMLGKLTVKGKAPKTGYNRTKWFGAAWSYDFNHNHCQTRQDILSRDMSKVRKKGKCTVRTGTLADPYDGKLDTWRTGKNTVDIDHVVALGNAWISGAQYWTGTRGQTLRKSIANDPLNLVAADASLNRSKGEKNAAEWLPKNKRFRCQYVATQISVKYKYRLAVTSSEKAAMKRVLSGCKTQRAAKTGRYSIATGKSVAVKKTAAKSTKAKTVSGTIHPGAFCATAQHGYKGRAASGKTYTCKTSSTEKRYRWRA